MPSAPANAAAPCLPSPVPGGITHAAQPLNRSRATSAPTHCRWDHEDATLQSTHIPSPDSSGSPACSVHQPMLPLLSVHPAQSLVPPPMQRNRTSLVAQPKATNAPHTLLGKQTGTLHSTYTPSSDSSGSPACPVHQPMILLLVVHPAYCLVPTHRPQTLNLSPNCRMLLPSANPYRRSWHA